MLFLFKKTCNFNTIGKNNHFFPSAKTFFRQNCYSSQTAHFTDISMSFVTEGCKISQNFGRLAN